MKECAWLAMSTCSVQTHCHRDQGRAVILRAALRWLVPDVVRSALLAFMPVCGSAALTSLCSSYTERS